MPNSIKYDSETVLIEHSAVTLSCAKLRCLKINVKSVLLCILFLLIIRNAKGLKG